MTTGGYVETTSESQIRTVESCRMRSILLGTWAIPLLAICAHVTLRAEASSSRSWWG